MLKVLFSGFSLYPPLRCASSGQALCRSQTRRKSVSFKRLLRMFTPNPRVRSFLLLLVRHSDVCPESWPARPVWLQWRSTATRCVSFRPKLMQNSC